MLKKDLIELCKKQQIKGYSRMTVAELRCCVGGGSGKMEIKPFIKWIGGKTQILDKVLSKFPCEIQNYYEPFLGGGSVLIGLLKKCKKGEITIHGNIFASDINKSLIYSFINIKEHCDEVIEEIQKIMDECLQYEKGEKAFYYLIRERYNSLKDVAHEPPLYSAMFIYLNKTGFRGMHREGPNGFNIPFGNYKNASIYTRENICAVSDLIKDVTFACCSFEESLSGVGSGAGGGGDFIYMDPPYAPETSKSFVSYNLAGFTKEQHETLFSICKNTLSSSSAKILMSNADVDFVKDRLGIEFQYEKIQCKRAINSKNPAATTGELLITNYSYSSL